MKKKLLAYSVGALCVGAIAYPVWKMITEKIVYHKDYQEQLELIVDAIEIKHWKNRNDVISWDVNIKIPEEPSYEKWNENFKLPRVLFKARKKGDDYYNIYSMSIDGKDIKLIATYEDFGGNVVSMGYFIAPSRSPDGRFILSTSSKKGYFCSLYDLNNNEYYQLTSNTCFIESWGGDGKSALVNSNGDTAILNLETKKFVYLKKLFGQDFEDTNGTFLLLNSKSLAISTIEEENDFSEILPGIGNQVVYEMPGFKDPIRKDYLSKECTFGAMFSVDRKYYTCNYSHNNVEYNIYSINKPKEIVGKSIGFIIIKPKAWAIQDGSIYREVQEYEDSPLTRIKYNFNAGEDYELKVYDNLYLPKNMQIEFDRLNISNYFPELPSKNKYNDTLIKMLYE
ncbi:hypothetical protein P0Y67_22295 [Photobacterium sp. SP02]|uniref:hypothetical protein n=1 Tax=Photobacterium sp. SP02 TaxID=3032280 RepID=UPI0031452E42